MQCFSQKILLEGQSGAVWRKHCICNKETSAYPKRVAMLKIIFLMCNRIPFIKKTKKRP